jgi:hypothetical protein
MCFSICSSPKPRPNRNHNTMTSDWHLLYLPASIETSDFIASTTRTLDRTRLLLMRYTAHIIRINDGIPPDDLATVTARQDRLNALSADLASLCMIYEMTECQAQEMIRRGTSLYTRVCDVTMGGRNVLQMQEYLLRGVRG